MPGTSKIFSKYTHGSSLSPFLGGGGKNTGVGCHSLLQEIFQTQGSNLGLQHCRQTLYHLSHQGSPYGSYGSHLALKICSFYKLDINHHHSKSETTAEHSDRKTVANSLQALTYVIFLALHMHSGF